LNRVNGTHAKKLLKQKPFAQPASSGRLASPNPSNIPRLNLSATAFGGVSHGKNDANYNLTQTQRHRWCTVTANTDKLGSPDHDQGISGIDRHDLQSGYCDESIYLGD
jgi:hypothetical protein